MATRQSGVRRRAVRRPRAACAHARGVALCLQLLLAAFTVLLLALAPGASAVSRAQERPPDEDVLILLDVTQSMSEPDERGNPPIWGPVKQSVTELVTEPRPERSLAIVPFAGEVDREKNQLGRVFPHGVKLGEMIVPQRMATDDDRADARRYLDGLNADQSGTYIVEAFRYGRAQLRSWRSAGRPKRQTLLLYTDGGDNHPARKDQTGEWIRLLREECAGAQADARQDQALLSITYVDLKNQLPTGTVLGDCTIVTVDPVQDPDGIMPPNAELRTQTLDLGVLSASQDDVRRDRLQFAAPLEGRVQGRALRLRVSGDPGEPPPLFESGADTTTATIGEIVPVTFRANPASMPGPHTARLLVEAANNDFTIRSHNVITLTYTVPSPPTDTPQPTPTFTPTPNPTATSTATATGTATAPPTNTPTLPPTSTSVPSVTPTSTSTPAGLITIRSDPPAQHLGSVRAGGDTPLDGQVLLRGTFNDTAARLGATANLHVTTDGEERPGEVGFPAPGGQPSARRALAPNSPESAVSYHVLPGRGQIQQLGTERRRVDVEIVRSNDGVQVVDERGQPVEHLVLTYDVVYPWDERHSIVLATILAILALILFLASRPRIPRDLEIFVRRQRRFTGGDLRPVRWLDGRISAGSRNDAIPLQAASTAFDVRPSWDSFSLRRARPGTKLWVRPRAGVTMKNGALDLDPEIWSPFYPNDALLATIPPANAAQAPRLVEISFQLPAQRREHAPRATTP